MGMKLGIRCWPNKFSFVVLDGDQTNPSITEGDVRKFPDDMTEAAFLNWISKEIRGILGRWKITGAAYKKIEPIARKNTHLLVRAEVEGVIQAVIYEAGCRDVRGLSKSQLKAELNFKGAASEVAKALDSSALQQLAGTDKEEAALAAWALLKK